MLSDRGGVEIGIHWMRPFIGALSPAGSRGRLTILIFHRVLECADSLFPDEMDPVAFRQRMSWIRTWFNVLPLEDGIAALSHGSLPARALAITFDDGYANNYTVALPILRQLNLHATFFIATAFVDGGRMWNDTVIEAVRGAKQSALDLSSIGLGVHSIGSLQERRQTIVAIMRQLKYLAPSVRQERTDAVASIANVGLPDNLMMTSAQVRGLAAAGMGIGGHTVTHPILAQLDDTSARQEIVDGRDALAAMVCQPINLFAYPNGKPGVDYTATHVRMVKELGLSAALSTAHGAARAGDSVHELPRFTPWGHASARWGWNLARNMFVDVVRAA